MDAGRLTKYRKLLEESGGNACSKRILSQIGFLLELSKVKQGRFDNTILPQIERLYDDFRREGGITYTSSLKVEKDLSLLGTEAKKYQISCILQPSIKIPASGDPTHYIGEVRQALHMLESFSEINYFEPRTNVYRLLECHQPLLLLKVRDMVKLGRWEVGLTSWNGMEPELQSGEEALSGLLENRKYLGQLLDIPPSKMSIYFQIEGYHTTPHLINLLAGCHVPYIYNYGGRKQDYKALVASDEMRIFQLDGVEQEDGLGELEEMILHLFQNSHTENILRVIELDSENIWKTKETVRELGVMAEWPLFGKIKFCFLEDYFQMLEQENLASSATEENKSWYSDIGFYHQPHPQISYNNRVAETDSRTLDGVAKMLISDYETASGYKGDSRFPLVVGGRDKFSTMGKVNLEHALNTLALSMDTTQVHNGSDKNTGFEQLTFKDNHGENHHLSSNTNNSLPFLFTVFNPSSYEKDRVVEAEIHSWNSSLDLLHVMDSKGRNVHFQIENRKENGVLELSFLAQLPPLSYMTYRVSKRKEEIIQTKKKNPRPNYVGGGEMLILENRYIRSVFSASTMSLLSFVDKKTGEELLNLDFSSGVFGLILEETQSGLSPKAAPAQEIILNKKFPVYIKDTFFGGVRCWVDYEIHFYGSIIYSRVILDQDAACLRWETKVHWLPQRLEPQGKWKLNFQVPYGYNSKISRYVNPWGTDDSPTGAQVFMTSSGLSPLSDDNKSGIGLISSGHHSLISSNGVGVINLLPWNTLPISPSKTYNFDYGLMVTNGEKDELISKVQKFLHPVYMVENSHHTGSLPPGGEVLTIEGKGVLSSLWQVENHLGIYMTFYNPTEHSQPMVVHTVREMKDAALVDFYLEVYENLHRPKLTQTDFVVPKKGIITLRLLFNE